MPEYEFVCDACETSFSVVRRMSQSSDPFSCPKCSGSARRVFHSPSVTYHCDGFHATDYGKGNHTGTKNDALNKAWSEYYGEAPPPPAKDVPRNGGEKY